MHRKSMNRGQVGLFAILVFVLIITGCGAGGEGAAERGSTEQGRIAVHIDWMQSGDNTGQRKAAALLQCSDVGVITVEARIYTAGNALLATGGPWECALGQGTITGIDPATGCTLVILGRNAEGGIIYRGEQRNLSIRAGETTQASIAAVPFIPQLISPANGTVAPSVDLQWSAVSGADRYEIRIGNTSDLMVHNAHSTTETHFAPPGVSGESAQYWQVAAEDPFGNTGPASVTWAFSLTLGVPVLTAPGNGAIVTTSSVPCQWDAVTNASQYRIVIADNPAMTSPIIDQAVSNTTYSYANPPAERVFYWQVFSMNNAGQTGNGSQVWSFSTYSGPTLHTPPANEVAAKETVQFAWSDLGVARYRIRVSASEDLFAPVVDVTTVDTTHTPPAAVFSDGSTYYWQVDALQGNDAPPLPSGVQSFSTLESPVAQYPHDNATLVSGTFGFQWQNALNGSGYRLAIATDDQMQDIVIDETVSSNTFTTHSLNHGDRYYWRVWALDSNGGGHDGYASATRRIDTLGRPSLVAPADQATTGNGDFNFSWAAVSGAASYHLLVSTNSNPQTAPIIDTTTTATTYHIADWTLENGDTYYWQVTAADSSANPGAGSDIFSLNTDRTVFLKDINPGTGHGSPAEMTAFGDYLFFAAVESDGAPRTLWRTDGTPAGTVKVGDAQYVSNLTRSGSSLYFTGVVGAYGNELCRMDDWQSDVISVIDVETGSDGSYPIGLTPTDDGYLYFVSRDGSHRRLNYYTPSTGDVTSIYTGINFSGIINVYATGDKLFFSANDAINYAGYEPWRLYIPNGRVDRIQDLNSGSGGSNPKNFIGLDNGVVFVANDGSTGDELWFTYGVVDRITLLKDIRPGSDSSNISSLTLKDDLVYFFADDNGDGTRHLWRTDGTVSGTVVVQDGAQRIEAGGFVSYMTVQGNELYFRAVDSTYGDELHRSDGTVAGTHLVRDIWPGATGSYSRNGDLFDIIYSLEGLVFFRGTDETYGTNAGEIWVTNGTAAGTDVIDILPGPDSSYPQRVAAANGAVYINAWDAAHGWELWKYVP